MCALAGLLRWWLRIHAHSPRFPFPLQLGDNCWKFKTFFPVAPLLYAGKQESFTLSRENNWRLCFAEGWVVSVCCCIHTGRKETPPLAFPHKFQRPREKKGWWENQGGMMTKSQRDFPPRSHPFLYYVCVSADLDLPLVPHALNLFFRPRDDSSSGTVLLTLRQETDSCAAAAECTKPGASSFLDEKEEKENLSPRHTQLSLSRQP